MKSVTSNIVSQTLESLKKNKKLYRFENYDLTQTAIRYYSAKYRQNTKYVFKKKKNCLYYIFELANFLKLLLYFFFQKKIDGIIYVNTNYKFNICKKIFNSSKFNVIFFKKNFNYTPFSNIDFIPDKFFNIFEKNNNIFFINRLILLKKILDFYKPKFIFSLEGDSVDEAIFAQICKKKSIPFFCLQHGNNSPFLLNKTSKYMYKNFFYDYVYLSRSKTHAEYLKKIQLVKKYILIKDKIFAPKKKRHNILICINAVGEKNVRNISQHIFPLLDYATVCAKNYPQTKIFVRLHPNQNSNKFVYNYFNKDKFYKNIIIQNPNNISVDKVLKTCVVAFFCEGSSLIMNAIQHSVIPIVLEKTGALYNLNFLKKEKALLTSKSLNSCYNLTFKVMQKPLFREKIVKNISNFNRMYFKNSTSKNILDVINSYTKYN